MLHWSADGPTLPTLALYQIGSYLGCTGRAANVIAKAALDPNPTSAPAPSWNITKQRLDLAVAQPVGAPISTASLIASRIELLDHTYGLGPQHHIVSQFEHVRRALNERDLLLFNRSL